MIEIDGLTKRYGDKTAVDGLRFLVEPGVAGVRVHQKQVVPGRAKTCASQTPG